MKSGPGQGHRIFGKPLDSLWRHGPLGTAQRANRAMGSLFRHVPGSQRLFSSIDKGLYKIHKYFDGSVDRKYGTDTSGYIALENLTIESKNTKDGIWYEPMSTKVFSQIMGNLNINRRTFDFVDFGSGKGRVLLLAANYEFRKVVGVEFSEELHKVATKNVILWNRGVGGRSNIETIHMDATEYAIPNGPVVLFFYSPFMGKTMARVLGNISDSFKKNPREIVVVFYGANLETIDLLKRTGFHERELRFRPDWTHFNKYRAFIFTALPPNRSASDGMPRGSAATS
jgi:SAM-dependent methyltransferase